MLEQEIIVQEQPLKKKRGRKPKNPQDKIYFGEKQENAVIEYIKNQDDLILRNRLYVEILRPAFIKMIESIIRNYKLYVPDEPFEDTVNDAVSNLAEQIDKFKINSGKKAYSYYGTIVKHYVLKRRREAQEKIKNNPSYDSYEDEVVNYSPIINTYEKDRKIAENEIKHLINRIKKMVENSQQEGLKKNEVKLGIGLITLLENWEDIMPFSSEKICADGETKYITASQKLNRSSVLLFLREQTGLDSKSIRTNMKKFRKEFLIIRNFVLNN